MLKNLFSLSFGVNEVVKYARRGLFTSQIFIPCINQRKTEPFMVEAHPCLMLSQEGDLDNRSYQRDAALCACACVCVCACVRGCVRVYVQVLDASRSQ